MRTLSQILSLGVLLALLGGCKGNDYLYWQEKPPATKIKAQSHKLKDLVVTSSAMDILWVIDNSGSMDVYQQAVIQNTQLFMDQFSKSKVLRWKMGLLSTDTYDRPYVGFSNGPALDSNSTDPVGVFQSAVGRLGTMGSPTEQGFDPILLALRNDPKFLRPNAQLAIIFVTDIDDQSNVTPAEFLTQLGKYIDIKKVSTYGVLGVLDYNCPGESDWYLKGSNYDEVLTATNGKTYPLCSPDFGTQLAAIGSDLSKKVEFPKLFLEGRPIASTIRVLYKDKEVAASLPGEGGFWYYDPDQNAIIFHDLSFAPGDNVDVFVDYQEDQGFKN